MEHQMDNISMSPSYSQQALASESNASASRANRARSSSHPTKAVFPTAKKTLQYQVSNVDLAQQYFTTTHQPSIILPSLDLLNLDNTHKPSDTLRFKSTLFSPLSNPEISVGYFSRLLEPEPTRPLEITHRETELPDRLHSVHTKPTAPPTSLTNLCVPARLTRLNVVSQDLTVQAQSSSLKKSSVNCFREQHRDCESISTQSLQLRDHNATDWNHPSAPNPISNLDHNHEESFDIEDLTTPTLKSCERFEDDNSITPCQTFSTPNFKKLHQGIRITPRMIYEDYQRKFNEEDVIIKSRDSHLSPSSSHEHPYFQTGANGSAGTTIPSGSKTTYAFSKISTMCSDGAAPSTSVSLDASLCDTSLEDSADESFESFGDDQIFGSLFSIKTQLAYKPNSQVTDVFPLPPVTRSGSCHPSNVQRTPSPKHVYVAGHEPRITTPDNVIPKIVMDVNDSELRKTRITSPLVLGKPLNVKPSIKNNTPGLDSQPSSPNDQGKKPFQLPPSPYRHVENKSRIHDGPDNLECSTRLMNMFDTFLECSPKNSGSNVLARSSLSKKSNRKLKLDESPLKKLSSIHFAETPELILQPKRSFVGDSFGLHSHGVPFNLPASQRPSSLAFESSQNPNADPSASLAVTNSTPLRKRLPNVRSSLSLQECCPSLSVDGKNKFLSRRVEHPSPASDSDDEPSQSPKTPFGNIFNPSNRFEPYVPFESSLSAKSLTQKLGFKPDVYNSLDSQPRSLEELEEPGSFHVFSKVVNSTKQNGNSTCTADPSHGPQLKTRRSIAKFMSNGLLSRFTNQKYPRGSFPSSDSIGNLRKGHQANSPTDEGFESSPHRSNWSSIIEHEFDQSRANSSLNALNSSRQKASGGKLISGRVLFQELDPRFDVQDASIMDNHRAIRSSNTASMTYNYSLRRFKNEHPHSTTTGPSTYDEGALIRSGKETAITHMPVSQSRKAFEQEHEILVEASSESTEDDSKDPQQILSPIRLYGKQQGILETGNWKTNNLNFQSMKSQYQPPTSKNGDRLSAFKIHDESTARRRDRTVTEETQKKKAAGIPEEDEEAEREKKESLMVYKIQEEDDNQIINFEINRLKKIFYNKALKSSKSKSKLSKPPAKLFDH
ncbi:hypothetical protein PtA15_2A27 [Puccinia triticina]|uniref:Uncharacterized protein n=1 Tax=Puccinia triticina TaxID=208348 RepID=A0ABY7CC39_9BASI|nr:uncharacterized protein PtA15_2A27 [Puccinia triticina]WAQ81716.1 hypothetical protein PtA15_2A27 [Puccinia triticina]WAR52604.1 hypothetical protein PtB15_2B28 [Puccinia triticina]